MWAVESLAVEPDDRVLEIGCGPGVAISLIAEQLDGGTITAIDRSSVAVERACWRNAAHLESGKATISRSALEEVEPTGVRYDKIFAVNVNVFWIRDVGPELELIRRLLAPEGSLFLFWGGTAGETRSSADRRHGGGRTHGARLLGDSARAAHRGFAAPRHRRAPA